MAHRDISLRCGIWSLSGHNGQRLQRVDVEMMSTRGRSGATQDRIDRVPESGRADHDDTSRRERRSIVAQRHAVQRADGITRFGRTRRGSNQRLHLITATLVTPTVRFPVPNYLTTNNGR
jgi:hypothetical protein